MSTRCTPGSSRTRDCFSDTRGPFKWVTDTFGSTPEKGADTVLWLATAPEAATVSGKLFAKRKEIRTPGQGSDPDARKRLWEESEKLTNRQRAADLVIGDSISACPEVAATRGRATVMSGSGRRAVGHPAHNQH